MINSDLGRKRKPFLENLKVKLLINKGRDHQAWLYGTPIYFYCVQQILIASFYSWYTTAFFKTGLTSAILYIQKYTCHKMIVAANLSQQDPFYCLKRILFCFIPDYIFVCYMACNNNKLPRMCKLVTYVYTSVMNFSVHLHSCEGCFVIHLTRFLVVNLT